MNSNRSTKMQQVTISTVGLTHQDGYSWRKYGQKPIVNAKHPREYYRCGHKDQGCKATKQVQMVSDSPTQYKIIYLGKHTCKVRPMDASSYDLSDSIELDSANMLSFNDSDKQIACSHQELIKELTLLDAARKTKHLQSDQEKQERLRSLEQLDLTTQAEADTPRLNSMSKQKQADAGSANTEVSREKHKEVATEETSSVEELQMDTNFEPINEIVVLKENTPTSSDQVLPHVSQDVARGLSLGSDVFPLPPVDHVGQLRFPNSFIQGAGDEKASLNNYLHCVISSIHKNIVKPEGKKRKVENVILSLTENYVRTVNKVAQLMEEDKSSTSNRLVEELEAKVELLKKRAEDAEGKLEKEQAAWQRVKDRYERRAIDAENEISDLEKKLDEAWNEKAELKASVTAVTKQMRLKCLDFMKRALAEYDKQISWSHVLRHFLYLEQQSDKDMPEADSSKGKSRATGSSSHPRETKNKDKDLNREKNIAIQEDEVDSTPEYSLNTITMTRLAL